MSGRQLRAKVVEFRPVVFAILLTGLFIIAMISFGSILSLHNNPQQSITNDPTIRKISLDVNKSLGSVEGNATAAEKAIGFSPISLLGGSVIFDAIAGIWKTLILIPKAVWNATVSLVVENIFGGNGYAVVISLIGGMLMIIIVFAVWKLVIQGEGG